MATKEAHEEDKDSSVMVVRVFKHIKDDEYDDKEGVEEVDEDTSESEDGARDEEEAANPMSSEGREYPC